MIEALIRRARSEARTLDAVPEAAYTAALLLELAGALEGRAAGHDIACDADYLDASCICDELKAE